MFDLDLDILHFFELLRSPNYQFFLILYYIADVVGSLSGAIGDESTLFEHGNFEVRIASFCPGCGTRASRRTANDDEFLSL
jgi:hypothetical protein